MGGQRSERRKWLPCFQDAIDAVLYVCNLAAYARVLFEDDKINAMHEDLDLFETTMANRVFDNKIVFLLFNKKDLLEQWLPHYPLKGCFPEYRGESVGVAFFVSS